MRLVRSLCQQHPRRWMFCLGLAALLTTGCGASDRDKPDEDIYPGNLPKSFFVGDLEDPDDDPRFLWRNFVVGVEDEQSLVGLGAFSAVDWVRFEIRDHLLVARSDDIVAAFPIMRHVENPWDRGGGFEITDEPRSSLPWQQRPYMQVDWSINIVEEPRWHEMFAGAAFGPIKVSPVAVYQGDLGETEQPQLELDAGYVDVANDYYVEAATPFLEDGPQLARRRASGAEAPGAAQRARVRTAFWREDFAEVRDHDPRAGMFVQGSGLPNTEVGNNGPGTPPPQFVGDPPRLYAALHGIWRQSHILTEPCEESSDCPGGSCVAVPDGGGTKACTVRCDYLNREPSSLKLGSDAECDSLSVTTLGSEGALTERGIGAGARCGDGGYCMLPLRDREVMPVPYWITGDTPQSLTDEWEAETGVRRSEGPTESVVAAFAQLLRNSVAKAREVECRRAGGERAACSALYFESDVDSVTNHDVLGFGGWLIERAKPLEAEVLVVCHDPVRPYDSPHCGAPGRRVRLGDLRHHVIHYAADAGWAPWAGIAGNSTEPSTGRIAGASATIHGPSVEQAAAQVRDAIRVALGELSMSDVTGQADAKLLAQRLKHGRPPMALSAKEIQRRTQSVDAEHAGAQLGGSVIPGETLAHKLQKLDADAENLSRFPGPAPGEPVYEDLAAALRDTNVEDYLAHPQFVASFTGMDGSSMGKEGLPLRSHLRLLDHASTETRLRSLESELARRGASILNLYPGDISALDVSGIARHFAEKYGDNALRASFPQLQGADPEVLKEKRAELLFADLKTELYKATLANVFARSLGMGRNLSASYDSLNYLPQYWQLRSHGAPLTGADATGPAQNCLGQPGAEGTACMGPRYLDPETDDELGRGPEPRPAIEYFAQSSVLDHPASRFFGTAGLGPYDRFALDAMYGGVLPVFDRERGYTDEVTDAFRARNARQIHGRNDVRWQNPALVGSITTTSGKSVPAAAVGTDAPFLQGMHYTEQARRLRAFAPERCRPATASETQQQRWAVVHGLVCAPPPQDHASWYDMKRDGDETWGVTHDVPWGIVRADSPSTPSARRWPFRVGNSQLPGAFGSAGHLAAAGDAGADDFERTAFAFDALEHGYAFSHFFPKKSELAPKDQTPFRWTRHVLQRVRAMSWQRTVEMGRRARLVVPEDPFAVSHALTAEDTLEVNRELFRRLRDSDDGLRPEILAASETFERLLRLLLAPEVGAHGPCQTTGDDRLIHSTDCGNAAAKVFDVDATSGRFVNPVYHSQYYSWGGPPVLSRAGHWLEQLDALRLLFDGRPTAAQVPVHRYLDVERQNLGMRALMPVPIDRLLGSYLSGDRATLAPFVRKNSGDSGAVSFPTLTGKNPQHGDVVRLLPQFGFNHQVHGVVFASLFAHLSGDVVLRESVSIYRDSANAGGIPLSEQRHFQDPESGSLYVARSLGEELLDGRVVDRGAAARMLEATNRLLALAYDVEGGPEAPVFDAFGKVHVLLDDAGQPIVRSDYYLNQFRNAVGLLDSAVETGERLGAVEAGP